MKMGKDVLGEDWVDRSGRKVRPERAGYPSGNVSVSPSETEEASQVTFTKFIY
jgi:hypothetical protein